MRASEAAKILTAAFVAWPNFPVTEPMAKLWAECFHDVGPAEFWEGMRAALKTHTGNFPPTIGQVTAALEKLRTQDEITEGEAWGLVVDAAQRFGRSWPKQAREYLLEKGGEQLVSAVRAFGWDAVCNAQIDDEPANRAHFWRVFSGIKNRSEFKRKVSQRVQELANTVVKQLEAKV